jgi:hypothetical protein
VQPRLREVLSMFTTLNPESKEYVSASLSLAENIPNFYLLYLDRCSSCYKCPETAPRIEATEANTTSTFQRAHFQSAHTNELVCLPTLPYRPSGGLSLAGHRPGIYLLRPRTTVSFARIFASQRSCKSRNAVGEACSRSFSGEESKENS